MYADNHQCYDINNNDSTILTKLQDCALNATTWYDVNFFTGNFKKHEFMLFSRIKDENEMESK